jgi:hypothetical protein
MRNTILVTASLAVIIASGSLKSYELAGHDWTHQDNPIEKEFTICAGYFSIPEIAVIKEAARKWEYAKLKFVFGPEECPTVLTFPPEALDGHSFIDKGLLLSGHIADAAILGNLETKTPIECDIRFSSSEKWNVGEGDPASDEYDLYSVAMHEFGHCLGLDHNAIPGTVMDENIPLGVKVRELTPDDIAGRAAIYGG